MPHDVLKTSGAVALLPRTFTKPKKLKRALAELRCGEGRQVMWTASTTSWLRTRSRTTSFSGLNPRSLCLPSAFSLPRRASACLPLMCCVCEGRAQGAERGRGYGVVVWGGGWGGVHGRADKLLEEELEKRLKVRDRRRAAARARRTWAEHDICTDTCDGRRALRMGGS